MNEFSSSPSRRREEDTVAPADQLRKQIKRSWTISSKEAGTAGGEENADWRVLTGLRRRRSVAEGVLSGYGRLLGNFLIYILHRVEIRI